MSIDGGVLKIGSAFAGAAYLPTTTALPVTINAGGTVDLNGFNASLNAVTSASAGTITDTGAVTALVSSAATAQTFNGTLAGALTLIVNGPGTLTLTGANSYAGGTALTSGTLAVGNSLALGAGALNMANGTTLQFTAPGLTLANAIAFGVGGPNIDTGANTETISGVISGNGGVLDKYGTGTLILTGANTYSGGTNIHAGTIGVGNNAALGAGTLAMVSETQLQFQSNVSLANAITLASGAEYIQTGASTGTLSGLISGSGALVVNGTGNLILPNANTFSGGVQLDTVGLTLEVGNSQSLGTGQLIMATGTTLQFTAPNLNLANNVELVGGVEPTIDTGAFTETMSGVFTGSAPLTKIGSGALILTGQSPTYNGPTEVSVGTLVVNGSLAGSAVKVDSGATLGGSGTVGAINALGGATVAPGVLTPFSTLSSTGAADLQRRFDLPRQHQRRRAERQAGDIRRGDAERRNRRGRGGGGRLFASDQLHADHGGGRGLRDFRVAFDAGKPRLPVALSEL